jgi:hypothetical protein
MRSPNLRRGVLLVILAACGGSSPAVFDGDAGTTSPTDSGGDTGTSGSSGGTSGSSGSSGGTDGGPGTDSGPKDAGPPPPTGWDGGFPGPLTCSNPGNFLPNGGNCGAERWSLKTGTDPAAAGISLLPTLTTIQALQTITAPTTFPQTTRLAPTEKTVFALKDIRLAFARLENDSDYHLMMSDTVRTIITEVPYPGGCTDGSAWQCLISRVRATVDAQNFNLQPGVGRNFNIVVSVIGVGFFDPEHGQFGAAPNTIELHPLLGICFGPGCDPSK